MSGWTIYWITRLEAVHAAAMGMTITGLVLGGTLVAIGMFDEDLAAAKRYGRWLIVVGAVGALLAVFVSTTKEAAAIVILPRLLSAEHVGKIEADAGDLYGLAKDWLRKQAEGEAAKGEPEAAK